MLAFLTGPGFLGSHAPFYADVTLILILISAVMMIVGRRLALQNKFKVHGRLQTAAVILNSFAVLSVMIASFIVYLLPGLPEKFFEGTYGITTVHAFIGTVSLLLGVFVVLRGHKLVPKRLRFKKYKPYMRTSFYLYMLSTVIGVIIYIAVYIFGK